MALSDQEFSQQFEAAIQRYHGRFVSIATRFVGNRAEDAVQEAYARAWKYRDRFEPKASLATWLFTIVRNASINMARGRSVDLLGLLDSMDGSPVSDAYPSDTDHLIAAFNGLGSDDRSLLRFVRDGFTMDEIADMTAMPLGSVKCRVHRARRKALALLEEAA